MTMTLVQTVTVGAGGAASIEFTNIPQTGQDLLVVFSMRVSGNANTLVGTRLNFNSDTSASYYWRELYGDGSAATSSNPGGADTRINPTYTTPTTNATTNTFGNGVYYIAGYSSSNKKSISLDAVSENNATLSGQNISAALYDKTNAITTLTLTVAGTIVQYSTASLYTISTTGATGATVS